MTNAQNDSNAHWYHAIAVINGERRKCPHRHASEAEAKACAEEFCDTVTKFTAEPVDIQYGVVQYPVRPRKRKAKD